MTVGELTLLITGTLLFLEGVVVAGVVVPPPPFPLPLFHGFPYGHPLFWFHHHQ
jgi:hypothetical protein